MSGSVSGISAPGRRRRSGRADVLWGLTIFVAVQAGYYPLAHYFPYLYDGVYARKAHNLKKQLSQKPSDQPCVIAFGSSLTNWGFNPSALTTVWPGAKGEPVVFNFGYDSGGVVVQLVCLHRLLAEGIHPDLVLIEAHPLFLYRLWNTVPGKHFQLVPRYVPGDFPVLRRFDPEWREFVADWGAIALNPWYGHRRDLQNYWLPKWVRPAERTDDWRYVDRNGWECIPHKLAAKQKCPFSYAEGGARHWVHFMEVTKIDETFVQVYRELIDLCQQNNIAVAMIRVPEMSCAVKERSPELQERIEERYRRLHEETGVTVIDARTWVDDLAFPDGAHLVPRGAAIFTQRLEREFLKPFFEQWHAKTGGQNVTAPRFP